jgi:very-short-patch-repair endonuclease
MKRSALEMEMRFQLAAVKFLVGMEEEYVFHPERKWRFDFAWPGKRIALEVEGGTFSGGRHTRGVGYEGDCEKYSEAALLGWKVFRVTGKQVQSGQALAWVEKALKGAEKCP